MKHKIFFFILIVAGIILLVSNASAKSTLFFNYTFGSNCADFNITQISGTANCSCSVAGASCSYVGGGDRGGRIRTNTQAGREHLLPFNLSTNTNSATCEIYNFNETDTTSSISSLIIFRNDNSTGTDASQINLQKYKYRGYK